MGEEQHTHGTRSARPDTRLPDRESERIAGLYAGYGRDPRKQRAWDARNAGNEQIREELLRTLLELVPELPEGEGRVLDAGCGAGWWLARLRREGVAVERLLGVDLIAARVQAAHRRLPGACVSRGDVRQLPFADRECALVLLFTVLSVMGSRADVRLALREARRVLAPGGAIAIWEPRLPTPNPDTRLIRLDDLREALGDGLTIRSVTLAPPLARRAGALYGPLVKVRALRTHRLVVARPG